MEGVSLKFGVTEQRLQTDTKFLYLLCVCREGFRVIWSVWVARSWRVWNIV